MPPVPQQRQQRAPAPPAGGGGGIPVAGGEGLLFEIKKFEGINTRTARTHIHDEQFFWLENLMPIDEGNLRSLGSNGAKIYSLGGGGLSIIYMKFFNIGSTQYVAVFLSDGTAYQVTVPGGVVTTISAVANTFYNGGPLPAVAQWGTSGIVIVGSFTNGYWAWDGTTLWPPGNATSPTWLNGGTATAMPNGVGGQSVEVFQSRVWITNATIFYFSAGGNGAQFAAGSGGGAVPATDSFLKARFTAFKQANGYLYVFGDSSINVISNVQTGAGSVTTFNNQNTDPQIGTPWPNTIVAWGRGLMFANPNGVYLLIGGAVEKISPDLDYFFQISTTPPVPSAAIHYLYKTKCYVLVLRVTDYLNTARNVMCVFTGQHWFVASQVIEPIFIDLQEISSNITAWGTDGDGVFALFTTPSASLLKTFQTKYWQGDSYLVIKQALRLYSLGEDYSGAGFSFSGTLDMQRETGPATAAATIAGSPGGRPQPSLNGMDQQGVAPLLGLTMQSNSTDFQLNQISLLYRKLGPVGG